ncbi:MAG: extracellular solute-binding protein [Anaerolineae bacterium]|nr:extracellular solute-binding protein [Anaerolineae bacterium]
MALPLLAPDDPALAALQGHPAFALEIIPWADYRARLDATLAAPASPFAAVCIPGHVWLPELAAAGQLAPLQGADPSALAAYNRDDLLPLVQTEAHFQGTWYLLPLFSDGHLIFYDPAVVNLPAEGVPTVSTLHLHELAAAAHRPPGRYGLALKAHPSEIFLDFLPFLWEGGAELLDADEQPAFHSSAGIAALERYCALREFCPTDTHTYGNAEIASALQNGLVAMATSWGGQAAPIFGERAHGAYQVGVFPHPWNATWSIALPANLPAGRRRETLNTLLRSLDSTLDQQITRFAGSRCVPAATAQSIKRASSGWRLRKPCWNAPPCCRFVPKPGAFWGRSTVRSTLPLWISKRLPRR